MGNKFLKILSFGGLAVFMGMAGVFGGLAVLPKTVLAESESFSAGAGGLIVPKADDPVVFTTESGLDIKYGNNLPDTYGESLSTSESGLSGFPYFTTNDGTKDYIWVIIGKGLDMSGVKTHEIDDSPAGVAIKSDGKFLLEDYVGDLGSDIVANAEIPDDCVLVLANDNVGSGVFNVQPQTFTGNQSNLYLFGFYDSGWVSDFKTAMDGYYNSTNKAFGLSALKNQILYQQVTTYWYGWTRASGDTGTIKWELDTLHAYLFPLAIDNSSSTFVWSTYLSKSEAKLSNSIQFLRGMNEPPSEIRGSYGGKRTHPVCYLDKNGDIQQQTCEQTGGYRPAFVLNLA